MTELQIIFDHLDGACCPEDVFGSDPGTSYRKLARAVHPDLHADKLAVEAFQKLNTLKEEADRRMANGEWGKKLPLPHCIPLEIGRYKVERKPTTGDIADLYRCKDHIVKVARSHDDNDLLRAEASALQKLSGIKPPVRDGVPQLIDSFQIEGAWKRQANVLTYYPGFYTAEQVRAKMELDPRTLVWIFKRMMVLLGWVHHFGFIHGAILPPHVLLYPDNDGNMVTKDSRKHSIRLVDWCYSVEFKQRTRLSSWVPKWRNHYPAEILNKTYVGPMSDIYMAAKLIRYLGKLPPRLDDILEDIIEGKPRLVHHSTDAWFSKWVDAATAEYGTPRWVEFNLPK